MEYMFDVWVNFFEREENGYNICEFHEWKKEDKIELVDIIPVLKVDEKLYNYILNSLSSLPEELLNYVRNKAFYRRNHEKKQIEYGFIVTDGFDVLAVETCGFNIPLKKSKLIPRHTKLALEMVELRDTDFKMTDALSLNKEYSLLSPEPATMLGLTRKERSLKQILFFGLKDVQESNNLDKLKYLYSEFNNTNYTNVKDYKFDDLFELFVKEISSGWSNSHQDVCKLVTYGQPHLENQYNSQLK